MTFKHLSQLIFLICLYSCSGNSENQTIRTGEKQAGLFIKNGPRQGFQYFDSTGTEYNYRYYTITITNDSIIPVHLEINISGQEARLSDSLKSKVFLLPRHLTPESQQFDDSISKELKQFLDRETDTPLYLIKTLKQTEKCVLTFGVLTDTKYSDPTTPYGTRLLTSTKTASGILIALKINEALIIPCGQLSYISK